MHTYTVLSLKTLQVKVQTRSLLKALKTFADFNQRPGVRVALWRDGTPMQTSAVCQEVLP